MVVMTNKYVEFAIHEFREIIPPTIFFAAGSNLIIFTQRTILADDLFQFVGLMVGTIVIVGGLTFFPALALGPAAEHFAMQMGSTY